MNKKYKVGIIGYGYWGPNIVRNFNSNPRAEVVCICDSNLSALKRAEKSYPDISLVDNADLLLFNKSIDIVGIITPLSSHFTLAKKALENGKHIFLEKPMAQTTNQAKELINIANEKKLIGIVDHTFLFTDSVKKIKEIIDSGELGEIFYFDSVRVNLGIFQSDINVIWDLIPHDLSILFHLIDERPHALNANGVDHLNNGLVDVAYLNLHYREKMIANFHVNWLSPIKIRKTLIGGSKKMIVFDDMQSHEKVKVYDKGITKNTTEDIHELLVKYRSGDMYVPNLSSTEALKNEVEHFLNCIDERKISSINNLNLGCEVVNILEKTNISLNKKQVSI